VLSYSPEERGANSPEVPELLSVCVVDGMEVTEVEVEEDVDVD